ncbi:MAG: glycerol-3-phosphate dehydrogenase [Gammaproteobacteria bacterium]|jgi:glycerol-3-phosphate dehydrogenase|nr:glycerol-3-phosphate dehydrogenase [Gammaproteobacteria bacterium]MDH3750364.1 glycerol-3-phosphate dehydrogenase [Gammaproteobacteria bacterium]MDH3804576.1 glycerol-3-phosphate dehydrogenase [Gammaproteobacteria bacterium]
MSTAPAPFDVAIIGAGINGAGIARDAALRGLRVIVLEMNDMCSGTSAISSRLIHGGLRYLEYGEIPLVHESLRERITLRDIAAHLVSPIRICIPIYESAKRGPLLIRLGMIAYDLLSVGKTVPGHDMLSRSEAIANEPGLEKEGLRGAARYYDAQVTFAERLVLENLLAARSAGAEINTYSQVTSVNIAHGSVTGLEYTDNLTGESHEVAVRIVINAAGPWVDQVLTATGKATQRFIGGTKGSHIVVGAFAGAPDDAYYVEAAADGRPFFIIPWNGLYLIGTTDIRYSGDLAEIRASQPEVDYLLNETNRVFPQAKLGTDDIHYAYAGVRPLPRRDKGPESSITRRHIIKKNRKIARGLVSIIGGKLTTYRNLAEQTVNRLGKMLGRKLPACRTQDTKLPGAYRLDEAREMLESTQGLSARGVDRLLSIYGGRAIDLIEFASAEPLLQKTIDAEQSVLAAEIVFAIREEMARTLIDIVHRRLMLGLNADQGRPLYEMLAVIAADEFGWSDSERHSQIMSLHAYSDSLGV